MQRSLSKSPSLSPRPGSASLPLPGKTVTVGPLGLENLPGAKALGPQEARLGRKRPDISSCEMSSLPTKRQGIGDMVGGTEPLEAPRSCEEE